MLEPRLFLSVAEAGLAPSNPQPQEVFDTIDEQVPAGATLAENDPDPLLAGPAEGMTPPDGSVGDQPVQEEAADKETGLADLSPPSPASSVDPPSVRPTDIASLAAMGNPESARGPPTLGRIDGVQALQANSRSEGTALSQSPAAGAGSVSQAWQRVMESSFIPRFLEEAFKSASAPFDTISTQMKSQIEMVNQVLPLGIEANAQVTFGLALEAEVDVGADAVVLGVNLNALELSTGYNLTYDFLAQNWKLSRAFEAKFAVFSVAAEYYVKLPSLRELSDTDTLTFGVSFAPGSNARGKVESAPVILDGAPIAVGPLFELEGTAGKTLTLSAETDLKVSDFLSNYVQQDTLWKGLADFFVPGYGNPWWKDLLVSTSQFLPGFIPAVIPIGYLLEMTSRESPLGLLAASGDVSVSATTGAGLNATVWGGLGAKISVGFLNADAALKVGVALTYSAEKELASADHLLNWSPKAPPLPGPAEIAEWFDELNIKPTGVTVITHGFGANGDSLMPLAQAINQRAGGWLLDYDVPGLGQQGYFDLTAGQSILPKVSESGASGEVVVLFDWSPETLQVTQGWGEAAGDALFSTLVELDLVDPTLGANNIPLHFIGHSFGAVVTSEAVERLARFEVPVDQVTYLDPHDFVQGAPVPLIIDEGQRLFTLGQPAGYGAAVWSNVRFADVYYETRGANGLARADAAGVPLGRPIPGAYNVLLDTELPNMSGPANPYPASYLSGDHSYAWESFYLATVMGGWPASANSPPPASPVNYGQTGYAFSRIALGFSKRPSPAFYTTSPDPQDHRNTPPAYVLASTGQPNAVGLGDLGLTPQQVTAGRWLPQWSSLTVTNGHFENAAINVPFVTNSEPGWTHHGGGGNGFVDGDLTNHYLALNSGNSSRTHNRFFIPADATHIVFEYQVDSSSAGDELLVSLDGNAIAFYALNQSTSTFQTERLVMPRQDLRGRAHTLTFALSGGTNGIQSAVRIDNVRMESENSFLGRTGDVIPIDLKSKTGGATFQLGTFGPLTTVTLDPSGDWILRTDGGVYGRIVFSDRVDRTPFASSGRFYFVPSTVSDGDFDEDPLNPGVQGVVMGRVIVNGSLVREFQIAIGPNFSTRGSSAVTSGTGFADILRVQQRLQFLGYGDAQGRPLVIDGVLGSGTQHAIGLFNAAVSPTPVAAAPSGKVNLDWINDPNAPHWEEIQPEFNTTFTPNTAADWGTNWTRELIRAASIEWNRTIIGPHPDLTFLRTSPAAGDSSSAIYGRGMGLDLDTPSSEALFEPNASLATPFFAVTLRPGSNTYYVSAPGGRVIVSTGSGYEAVDSTSPGFDWSKGLRAQDVWDNATILGALKDEQGQWLLVDAPGYSLQAVHGQLQTFAKFTGQSTRDGVLVQNIYYNDPRTWDLPGVKFRSGNNGHATIELQASLISRGQQEKILSGLEGFSDSTRGLESLSELGQKLPFVDRSIVEQLSVREAIDSGIIARTRAYFAADSTPTAEEWTGALSAQPGGSSTKMSQSLSIDEALAPPRKSQTLTTSSSLTADTSFLTLDARSISLLQSELVLHLVLSVSQTKAMQILRTGTAAQALGIRFDATASAALTTGLNLTLDMGLALAPELSAEDAFFVRAEKMSLQASIQATALSFAAQIEPFKVAVTGGSLSLDSKITIDFKDTRLDLRALRTAQWRPLVTVQSSQVVYRATLPVTAEPFMLGGLNVALSGTLTLTNENIDYSLTAALSGELFATLEMRPFAIGDPSRLTFSKSKGLELHARARAFGVGLVLDGALASTDSFEVTAKADPFDLGGTTVILSGSVFQDATRRGFELKGTVTNWKPVSFLTVENLSVTLDPNGIGFDTTTDVAGVNGVRLLGTYRFEDGAYRLGAAVPVDWTVLSGVNLANVLFVLSNQNADGSKGNARLTAGGSLRLFGINFNVVGNVTSQGAWIAARPAEAWSPIPGLVLNQPVIIATTYEFTLSLPTFAEVTVAPAQNDAGLRRILSGINLVASTRLPEHVPIVGGSEAQISGILGTSLSQMALEAKLALARPPEVAGLLAFDSIGMRITGEPSISVFGEGRVLHDRIPGLGKDLGIRAALTLDILHTTLSGSLSLLARVDNVFGVQGLTIIEGDGEFGVNFATTPLPLPTMGFNIVVEVPAFAQNALALPPRLAGAFNVSTTEPIMAMSALDWQPFAKLGLGDLKIQEGTFVYAPNGGSIGLKVFPRGMSASFIATLFGTDVNFAGRLDEQTQGADLEAYVSAFRIAGMQITGNGPDGIYQDGQLYGGVVDPDLDNGAYFKARLTPNQQTLTLSGRINLPGKDASGNEAFVALTGTVNSNGIKLEGQIQNWRVVPPVLEVNAAAFVLDVSLAQPEQSSVMFSGELQVLHVPVIIVGKMSRDGVSFTGTLKNPGSFAGLGIGSFTLSFSTLPSEAHLFVEFTLDLPGQGGVTTVRGGFANDALVLDGQILDWRPIIGLDFDGTLHASLPASTDSGELGFDVTGIVLGVPARFIGSLSSSPQGFDLFAAALITVKLSNGQKLIELNATIDLGKDSPFSIGLAADFTLPGSEPAEVQLAGFLDEGGFTIFGRVDDWQLVPGLAFEGLISVRTDARTVLTWANSIEAAVASLPRDGFTNPVIPIDRLPPTADTGLRIEIDVSTLMIGAKLRLTGKVVGGENGLDLDLSGNVHFGGPKVAMVSLNLQARLVTETTLRGKVYQLQFDGDLRLFGSRDAVHASATFVGSGSSTWTITVQSGARFGFDATLDDIIDFHIGVDINGELRFGSDPGTLRFDLKAKGSASAKVPKFNLSASIDLNVEINFDLSSAEIRIPNARPKVIDNIRIDWRSYSFNAPEPEGPSPTVTVKRVLAGVPRVGIVNPASLQIRGSSFTEHVEVSRTASPPALGRPGPDTLHVRAAVGNGEWIELFETDTSGIILIDVDLGGGNDSFEIVGNAGVLQNRISIPTLLRGGPGSDTLIGSMGPNIIYGESDATGTIPRRSPFPLERVGTEPDGNDLLVGGPNNDALFGEDGNDVLKGGGGSDTLDGGAGVNVIDGTLDVKSSRGNDQIQVRGTTARFLGRDGVVSLKPGLTVQIDTAGAGPITVTRLPLDEIQRLQIDAGSGNDTITIMSSLTLPATLKGGPGNDLIQAGNGPTTIYGGDGADDARGGPGNDAIYGESGRDILSGGGGNDLLNGGPGQNTIHPGIGSNIVEATDSDFILNEGGADSITGGRPVVLGVELNGGASQRSTVTSIALRFSRDVSSTLTVNRVGLARSNGEVIPFTALSQVWDPTSNTSTITFPGLSNQRLPEGEFTLSIIATEVKDVSGNLLTEFSEMFTILMGDASGDGQVNELDLYQLWQAQLGIPGSQTPSDDLNGDGQVNTTDLDIVRGSYLRSRVVPAPLIDRALISHAPQSAGFDFARRTPIPSHRPGLRFAYADPILDSRLVEESDEWLSQSPWGE